VTDERTPEQKALDDHYAAIFNRERQNERLRPMVRKLLVAVLTADPRELPEGVRVPARELLDAANGGTA
jgi:hypothetical protein